MWFLKKKKTLSYPERIKEAARVKGLANLLSPAQIDNVIAQNQDLDFLDIELKEAMNYPDVDYLIQKLVPTKQRRTPAKPISMEDVMMGAICGDIIGSKFEFTVHDYESVRTIPLPDRKSYHTDDTVLTRATLSALQKCPENPDFRQAYLDAYQSEKGAGYGSAFVQWAENGQMFYTEGMQERPRDNTVGYHSCANGCAMRISPIPVFYSDLPTAVKHAVNSCMVTHDHVESVKAVIVLTVAMWMALHDYTKQEIYNYCDAHYQCSNDLFYKASQFDMSTELRTITNDIVRKSLMANYAVPFAVKCFCETSSFEECMREILSHYGDTDTICAIAGGLCVAYYGTTGMNVADILQSDIRRIEPQSRCV